MKTIRSANPVVLHESCESILHPYGAQLLPQNNSSESKVDMYV